MVPRVNVNTLVSHFSLLCLILVASLASPPCGIALITNCDMKHCCQAPPSPKCTITIDSNAALTTTPIVCTTPLENIPYRDPSLLPLLEEQ